MEPFVPSECDNLATTVPQRHITAHLPCAAPPGPVTLPPRRSTPLTLFPPRANHLFASLHLPFLPQAPSPLCCFPIPPLPPLTGPITTFILEPFVPHTSEYYLSVGSERLAYELSFCEAGGMDIEEHWDKLRTVRFDTTQVLTGQSVARFGTHQV